jgi:dTMP kinase
MARGVLITIEGIDGAGKTTLASALETALRDRGIAVRLLREPGGVVLAERIRELVKDPGLVVGARAEALLYAAARAQLTEETLVPLLESGTWVLLDRYVDSSLAYQGAGRLLGIAEVRAVNDFATGGLTPDRTLLLTVEASLGRRRAQARGEPVDRLEREREDFYLRTAAAYADLATAEPQRIRTLDASKPPPQVLADALAAVADLL